MSENNHDWHTGRHVVYDLHAHIILVTKYRRQVMTPRVSQLMKATLLEVCERFECTLDAFETDRDHAHLLVTYPPKTQLSTLVMSMKTNTSKRLREQHWPEIKQALWGKHFWSPSYCVVSCGGAPLEIVKQYVENQQKPNRKYRKKKQVTP
ncbi:IS200/IS605 family transposase [Bifidobacterium sp. SO1]|uniref:IS200/IS605 family transposase n=1 Tax=Bifidobacterium sp. SO1 TaxID=2809029 RepID=UPI001BDCA56B|nr:IS200/IS605 family transposase [Bifidobacterium sp. SO1]MBT1162128.1 IS200/IS605 family transposase [Bifidobacterium sp. SO1]